MKKDIDKGSKYFNGYKYDEKVKLLSIFLIKDDLLLKKYNKIWDKVSITIKKDLIANLCTMKHIKKLKSL